MKRFKMRLLYIDKNDNLQKIMKLGTNKNEMKKILK